MEKNLIKIGVALLVVVLIAQHVAKGIVRKTLAAYDQSQASKTWQSPLVAQPMADEAFVNFKG